MRRRHGLTDVKLVLLTNASLLDRPLVRRALTTLDANNGEIWAKLDAGTEDYYRLVARSAVPWRRILDNLQEAAVGRPIVIQSLLMRIRGEAPSPAELEAYCERLQEILAGGGQISWSKYTRSPESQPKSGWLPYPTPRSTRLPNSCTAARSAHGGVLRRSG